MTWNGGAVYDPTHVASVVLVAMRNYKAAVDAVDAEATARAQASLNALDSDWLTTVYAEWQGLGFPTIPK